MNIKPEDVYKYRSALNPLYTQDIRFESDLVDSIYNVLDNTNLIESYNFDLGNNNITVTLSEESKEPDTLAVLSSIQDTVSEYALKNIKNLDTTVNKNELEEFCKESSLITDHFIMGKEIHITL